MNQIDRHLRIFISSTFEDMNQERDILLKNIFLHVKNEAKKRDIEITEIDLRWGITEEDSSNGRIVKVCLDEIEKCKGSPIFFLGILGNRYGWDNWYDSIENTILDDENYKWIEEYKDRSITELEIISALKENNSHCLFYIKNSLENEDIRLINLKEDIKNKSNSHPNIIVDNYNKADDLKDKIQNKFIKLLDELFVEDIKTTEVENIREYHNKFAKSRQKIYIEHYKNESRITNFLNSEEDRLLIFGDSGLGKSALISNFLKKYKKTNSEILIIEHYIGSADERSNDLYQILRRIMMEIKEYYKLDDEVSNKNDLIINDFALWLNKISSPMLIVLDGYNQIEDNIKEKLFYYLPDKMKNIKLIITSTDDNYPVKFKYKIEELSKNEQRYLIENYLFKHGKRLDQSILNNILEHSQTNNTLFLKVLLDDIRLIGNYSNLSFLIKGYLEAETPIQLFIKVFERYETDYEKNTSNLTKHILSLLYVSRDGLSETNLIEILNINRLDFSPLFLALEEHLINKDGLYGFFHDYIRSAVKSKYFSDKKTINLYRKKVTDYFEKKDLCKQKIRELPYHLYKLKNIKSLYSCLFDINFFIKVQESDELELLSYIRLLEKETEFIEAFYKKVYQGEKNLNRLTNLAHLFQNIYIDYVKALALFKKVINLNVDKTKNIIYYNNMGGVYTSLGKYRKSLDYHLKSKALIEQNGFEQSIDAAICFNSLGYIYSQLSKIDESFLYYKKALKLRKKLLGMFNIETAISYNNMAELYYDLGKYKKALRYYKKAELIHLKSSVTNPIDLSTIYNNIALCFENLVRYNNALVYSKQSLSLSIKSVGKHHPDTIISYDNLASLYFNIGQIDKCIIYQKKALKSTEKHFPKKHFENYYPLGNMAVSYVYKEDYNNALKYIKKTIEILDYNFNGTHKEYITVYNNLVHIYKKFNNYKKAFYYIYKSIEICKTIYGNDYIGLASSYKNLADIFEVEKKYNKSLKFYNKALKIWENKLEKNHPYIANCYNNIGYLYESQKLYKKAKNNYERGFNLAYESLGKKHKDTISYRKNLERLINTKKEK